jgi:DNA-binding GntR family transcriptional regulator
MPPRSPEPPSVRVERELRERISGMASGEQLPPVTHLADDHHTAKATVEKVLRRLADDGLVRIWPRYGTFKA